MRFSFCFLCYFNSCCSLCWIERGLCDQSYSACCYSFFFADIDVLDFLFLFSNQPNSHCFPYCWTYIYNRSNNYPFQYLLKCIPTSIPFNTYLFLFILIHFYFQWFPPTPGTIKNLPQSGPDSSPVSRDGLESRFLNDKSILPPHTGKIEIYLEDFPQFKSESNASRNTSKKCRVWFAPPRTPDSTKSWLFWIGTRDAFPMHFEVKLRWREENLRKAHKNSLARTPYSNKNFSYSYIFD